MIPSTLDLLREELAHKRTINCDTITLAVPLVEELLARGDAPIATIGGGWFAPLASRAPYTRPGEAEWNEAWSRIDAEDPDDAGAEFRARRLSLHVGED